MVAARGCTSAAVTRSYCGSWLAASTPCASSFRPVRVPMACVCTATPATPRCPRPILARCGFTCAQPPNPRSLGRNSQNKSPMIPGTKLLAAGKTAIIPRHKDPCGRKDLDHPWRKDPCGREDLDHPWRKGACGREDRNHCLPQSVLRWERPNPFPAKIARRGALRFLDWIRDVDAEAAVDAGIGLEHSFLFGEDRRWVIRQHCGS